MNRKIVSFLIVEHGEGQPVLDDESSAYGWLSIDEALGLQLYPGTKLFFEKIKAGEVTL